MSSPDADTLELASQLLSFSPARVDWSNGKPKRRGGTSQLPLNDESELSMSVETKAVQLERSRRQMARNAIEKQLDEYRASKFSKRRPFSSRSLYAYLRMWTRNDLKEQFKSPRYLYHSSRSGSTTLQEVETAAAGDPQDIPKARETMKTAEEQYYFQSRVDLGGSNPKDLLQGYVHQGKQSRKWWKKRSERRHEKYKARLSELHAIGLRLSSKK